MADIERITGETDHFWYRVETGKPYIDSQRGNRSFGRGEGRVFLSEDCGRTWPYSASFPDADNVTFSCILRNGNVLFGTLARLYLSTDNLETVEPITVRKPDGSNYVPHVPLNPDLPGWYFHTLSGQSCWDANGTEMVVWGNYCNVRGGRAPVNIYYSTDSGRTVGIAYSFGQSPHWQEQGAPGEVLPGPMLGDADNPVLCRHIHTVAYNRGEDAFYACTGDADREDGFECHWLRGTYDAATDEWDWKVIVSDHLNSRYKCGGITFVDGECYWISDANGPPPHDRGIFRCAPADISNPDKHERLFDPEVESGCMVIQDGVFLASHCSPASPMDTGIIISADAGRTWAQYDLTDCGPRSPVRFHERNSDGWFRVDLRSDWIDFTGEVLFIKPKLTRI